MADPTTTPNALEKQLRHLLEMLREASTRADERAKTTHERFNVFTTLLNAHDEVCLHTSFLHCLLDPEGCHDLRSRFLDLFFATLHAGFPAEFNPPSTKHTWNVAREFSYQEFGRIDLLLETSGYGIAIENKIYAVEQEKQLARYAAYIEKRHGRGLVLFLTLDGKPSKTHEGRIPYLRISYATHILAWLETCLRETYQIPPINQVLQQYRAVVRKLTGKNIESSAMKNISDFIRQHPDIIHFRKQIDEGINEACASYLDDLADGIIKELQKHNEFSVRLAHELRFGTDLLGSLIITLPPNSILRSVPCEICVENDKEWNTLCVGITIESVKALVLPEHEVLFRKMQELLALDANRIGYYNPKITNHWPTGWLHLIEGTYDDERLAELIRKPLSETVSNVCGNVRSYIALLEAVCTKATQATSTPPRTTTLIAEEKTLPPSSSA